MLSRRMIGGNGWGKSSFLLYVDLYLSGWVMGGGMGRGYTWVGLDGIGLIGQGSGGWKMGGTGTGTGTGRVGRAQGRMGNCQQLRDPSPHILAPAQRSSWISDKHGLTDESPYWPATCPCSNFVFSRATAYTLRRMLVFGFGGRLARNFITLQTLWFTFGESIERVVVIVSGIDL